MSAVRTETCPDTGIVLKIEHDDDCPNPRTDHDNLFTFLCIHSRYNLGDPHDYRPVTRNGRTFRENVWNLKSADDLYREIIGSDEFDRLSELDDKEYNRIEALGSTGNAMYPASAIKEMHRQRQRDSRARLDAAIAKVCPIFEPLGLYDHSGLHIYLGGGPAVGDSAGWDSGTVGFAYITRDRLLKEYGGKRVTKSMIEKARSVLEAEVEEYDDYLCGDCYGYTIKDADGEHLASCWGFIGDIDYCISAAQSELEYYIKDAKEAAANEADRQSFAATSGGD